MIHPIGRPCSAIFSWVAGLIRDHAKLGLRCFFSHLNDLDILLVPDTRLYRLAGDFPHHIAGLAAENPKRL